MNSLQGQPCWYELGTTDLAAAQAFYAAVLGWNAESSPTGTHPYMLFGKNGTRVGGMLPVAGMVGNPPPHWLSYFVVQSADAAVAAVLAAGGQQYKEPTDVPDLCRFAVVADPQGAAFGVLQPFQQVDPDTGGAYDQRKEGHGHWHELMTTDPKAAQAFYLEVLGWQPSRSFDMGEMGTYQIVACNGQDIGGIMALGEAPKPAWLPYFGTDGASAAIDRIKAAGGTVVHGPMEVPGPDYIAVAIDPQGAHFAVVSKVK